VSRADSDGATKSVAPLPTAPLRAEHRELRPHIDDLRAAAELVGSAPIAELRRKLGETCDFLAGHLIPHALAEDEVLYPAAAGFVGTPLATATMSRDHTAVLKLTNELAALRRLADASEIRPQTAMDLRRVLYGLHALVSVHFAKEEEILLPLLDERLTPAAAGELFAAMERAAARFKAAA
jgi:iron-sulfur cluster repair protein YtfE (RIC family)